MPRAKKDGKFLNCYVENECYDCLVREAEHNGQTITAALERILEIHFGIGEKSSKTQIKENSFITDERKIVNIIPTSTPMWAILKDENQPKGLLYLPVICIAQAEANTILGHYMDAVPMVMRGKYLGFVDLEENFVGYTHTDTTNN